MESMEQQAKQMATNFTIAGVEGMIRNAKRNLAEIDDLDKRFKDVGGEARAQGRALWQEKLLVAERAMGIHRGS